MEIKFIDPEKQELYEKLFNTYWRHFKDNYDEYCEKFEKVKLQDIQTLRPEETIVVSNRSVDLDHKISIADTVKTLKKLVPFDVITEL